MYPHKEQPPYLVIGALAIVLILLIVSSTNDESTKYRHAKVTDVIMPIGYTCDFGVLYNDDGILMETRKGNNIECTEILLTSAQWQITPFFMIKDQLVPSE